MFLYWEVIRMLKIVSDDSLAERDIQIRWLDSCLCDYLSDNSGFCEEDETSLESENKSSSCKDIQYVHLSQVPILKRKCSSKTTKWV